MAGFEKKNTLSRRSLFAAGWAALASSTLANAEPQTVAASAVNTNAASSSSQVKTLVCIYLLGGSDGNSLVAPLESSQYAEWATRRGELGLRTDGLLPVRSRSGAPYGLHYALPELQKYFEHGSAAVVANVGPATRPSPLATTDSRRTPAGQYSSLRFLPDGYVTLDWAARLAGQTLDNDVSFTVGNGVSMMPVGQTKFQGQRRGNRVLMEKIAGASFRASFPESAAGRKMRSVAGLIKAGNVSGAPAQLIFCPLGGFASSTEQASMKSPVYRDLSLAISALHEATREMGLADSVTIFTDSEYGRTLRPNANHGADPGWGNHHFVVGGAVRGGDLFGRYPDMASGPFDKDTALIPTTSRAQYYATLATWLGVAPVQLPSLLPELDAAPLLQFLPS